jgi:hypothetical protein
MKNWIIVFLIIAACLVIYRVKKNQELVVLQNGSLRPPSTQELKLVAACKRTAELNANFPSTVKWKGNPSITLLDDGTTFVMADYEAMGTSVLLPYYIRCTFPKGTKIESTELMDFTTHTASEYSRWLDRTTYSISGR